MIEVRVKRNESIERALSRFKKKVKEDGFLFTLKERQYYTKPSEERREKKNRAKRRNFYNRLRDEKSFR
jgi:small subunit ribosomal protein S21